MPMDERFWHKDNNSTPIIVTIVLAVIAMLGLLESIGLCASPSRQEEVATKGAKIIPFDLEQTVHHFQPLGGEWRSANGHGQRPIQQHADCPDPGTPQGRG